MKRAIIFPGQGSQIIGMGQEFYNSFPAARSVFSAVDDILNFKLSKLMFEGPLNELTLTKNAQPALMTVSIAIMNVIVTQTEKKVNHLCDYVAGHSLGEYSALCAAEAISIVDTAKLLQIRGSSMFEALPSGVGGMAACLGISLDNLQNLLTSNITDGVCQIANDNVDGQIVISGHVDNINKIIELAPANKFKAIKLNVSSAFHSELMKPAEGNMQAALAGVRVLKPKVPLINNVAAKAVEEPQEIKDGLIKQICHQVKWRQTMDELYAKGVEELIEVGSGQILLNMAKKSPHKFKLRNISTIKEMDAFCHEVT